MPTDRTQEDTIPDSISPEDALTLALTSKSFAKHVVKQALTGAVPSQAGASIHRTAEQRHNARLIRENKIKASETRSGKLHGLPGRPPGRVATGKGRTSLKPLWNGEQLRHKLQSYNRTPFLDLLAMWMECAPDPQTIMAFADKYPDRWTKALLDLGRLGGFAEKKEIDINFAAQVAGMSDSQLEDLMQEQAYRLGIPLPALLNMQRSQTVDTQSQSRDRSAIDITPQRPEGVDAPTNALDINDIQADVDTANDPPPAVGALDLNEAQDTVGDDVK